MEVSEGKKYELIVTGSHMRLSALNKRVNQDIRRSMFY